MSSATQQLVETTEGETASLDFKASFDPCSNASWIEFVKDVVAMANSGGGVIVFGVNDDGTPSGVDLSQLNAVDPATIVDKVRKYTGQNYAGATLHKTTRNGAPVVCASVAPVTVPMVFTSPGTYEVAPGKQKAAFSSGTVYFRHGAKSEPGTSEDLRAALSRELDRVRSSWLDGIAKVVTAPIGATVQMVSTLPAEMRLSNADNATSVRLVNDDTAPAFKAVRTDLLYPFRQKEVVSHVNAVLGAGTVSAHDVFCVRKAHAIEEQPNFYYKPQYSSPQYSQAFVDWMVEQYRGDPDVFAKARDMAKK